MSSGCNYWYRFAKKLEQTDTELFGLLIDIDDPEPYMMNYKVWSDIGMGSWIALVTKMGWVNREIKFEYSRSGVNSELYSSAEFDIMWIKVMELYRNNRDEFRNKIILGLI